MWTKNPSRPLSGKAFCLVLCACAGIALRNAQAAVTVTVSTTVTNPTKMQSDFIAATTNQWESVIKPGLFVGDFKITISTPKAYTPPVVSSPILTWTAVDECFALGYAFGMEGERTDDLNLIDGLRDNVLMTDTCGGLITGTTVAADAYLDGCWTGYNIATSTISQRDGMTPIVVVPRK